uniref:Uncharacterized protein n=1 Tax=Staphylococcus aureus TaxID=1280 RepID=A0A1I9S2Y1_STAAU|nr:Hypothetical protein [Staphylococcus aureus]
MILHLDCQIKLDSLTSSMKLINTSNWYSITWYVNIFLDIFHM